MKRIVYIAAMAVLIVTIIFVNINTDISESELYFLAGLIVLYGALLILHKDLANYRNKRR